MKHPMGEDIESPNTLVGHLGGSEELCSGIHT